VLDAAGAGKSWYRFERVDWGFPFPAIGVEWLSSSDTIPAEISRTGTLCSDGVRFGGVGAPWWLDELLIQNGFARGDIPRNSLRGTVFPTLPAWRWLIVDAIVWGACIRGLQRTATFFRSWRQRRRLERVTCCRSCGYPVGISSVCTECGKPVVPKNA
jgi:hypothetical protein